MPQLTISANTYEKLARRAAELNIRVEQLVAPVLELIAGVAVDKRPSVCSFNKRPNLQSVEGSI